MTVPVGGKLEVEIERAIYRGLGLAHHDGQVILVERGLPGERARIEVEASHRSYLRARVEAVLDPRLAGGCRRAAHSRPAAGAATRSSTTPTRSPQKEL